MAEIFYDLSKPDSGMNYRWVQPPQIAYFVTTTDKRGNVNTTPVTLGTCVSVDMNPSDCGNYYFAFGLGYSDLPHVPPRQGQKNLEEVPECVISYIGSHLFRETQITGLPIPRGISEIDIAGLTELPSKLVKPPGIREARVNLEAKITSTAFIGEHYKLYVANILGASVDEDLVETDRNSSWAAGILALDPLFEFTVQGKNGSPPRIHTIKLDKNSTEKLPDDIGPSNTFVGTFENWMEDERNRGKIDDDTYTRITELNRNWQENPDPEFNREIKSELTAMIRDLII